MSRVQQNVIKHKVGLLNLVAEFGNVSRACKVMGFPVRACAIFASDLPSWPK
jgi:molybdenum-dependent DNA-binding transcriptional regulator ModE